MFTRFLWAGGPHLYNADGGAGSAGAPAGEAGKTHPDGDNLFDKGYGKGVAKGKSEATASLLAELGVDSLDGLKAAVKSAGEAQAAARKAAEEQGQFKSLYETAKAEVEALKPFKARVEQIEQAQKAQLAEVTAKLTDADKALLAGLPTEKALAMAQRLSAGGTPPVGGKPAGNGGEPGNTGTHDMAYFEKKGWRNLTAEEKAEYEALHRAQNSTTIGQLSEAARSAPAAK